MDGSGPGLGSTFLGLFGFRYEFLDPRRPLHIMYLTEYRNKCVCLHMNSPLSDVTQHLFENVASLLGVVRSATKVKFPIKRKVQ